MNCSVSWLHEAAGRSDCWPAGPFFFLIYKLNSVRCYCSCLSGECRSVMRKKHQHTERERGMQMNRNVFRFHLLTYIFWGKRCFPHSCAAAAAAGFYLIDSARFEWWLVITHRRECHVSLAQPPTSATPATTAADAVSIRLLLLLPFHDAT